MEAIKSGDQVAIMPSQFAPASEVLEIVTVIHSGTVYVQLMDGRMYATIGGKSFARRETTYIVPTTDEHRETLRKRTLEKAIS